MQNYTDIKPSLDLHNKIGKISILNQQIIEKSQSKFRPNPNCLLATPKYNVDFSHIQSPTSFCQTEVHLCRYVEQEN
jgi:hypothetical protein